MAHITPVLRKTKFNLSDVIIRGIPTMDENDRIPEETEPDKLGIEPIPRPVDEFIGVLKCKESERKDNLVGLLYYFKHPNDHFQKNETYNFYLNYMVIPKTFKKAYFKITDGKYKYESCMPMLGCVMNKDGMTASYRGYFAIRIQSSNSLVEDISTDFEHAELLDGSSFGCATLINNNFSSNKTYKNMIFKRGKYFYIPFVSETGYSVFHKCKPKHVCNVLSAIQKGVEKIGFLSPLKIKTGKNDGFYYFNKGLYIYPKGLKKKPYTAD